MYLSGQDKDSKKSQSNSRDCPSENNFTDRSNKLETVVYKDLLGKNQGNFNAVGYPLPTSNGWSSSSFNSGALISLEDIGQSYDRNANTGSNYGIQQQYTPFSWQNPIAYNQNVPSSSALETSSLPGGQDGSCSGYTGYTGGNNINDINNLYVPGSSRLDRAITVSDLMKLTEAINELTKRMPLPPTEELLKAIEPNLAMTLQLTYLHAYIQNQQLLIDIKNRILGGVLNNCDFKGALKPAVPTLVAPPIESTHFGSNTFENQNTTSMSLDVMQNYTWNNYSNMGVVSQQMLPQNQQFAIGPSISDTNVLGRSFGCGDSQDMVFGDGTVVPYPSFVEAIDALNQTKNQLAPQVAEPPPAITYDTEMSVDLANTGSENGQSQTNLPAPLPSPKDIMNAIPREIRNMVKYDGQKHSFVSVYLGPLGARRRRLFSIRKFGIEGALKLATDFAVGSTSAAVATKERRLLEEVCEVALKFNQRSGEKLEHIDEAMALPETRGLVFSCGAQLWMVIIYNANTGDRHIETFSVEKLGFEGAYMAAVSALDAKLQNSDIITSKLSGPLYFWLEGKDDNLDLCLMVTPRDLLRQGSSEHDLYIGRFNILKSGGFNSARKLAQKWRSDLRSQLIH